MNSRESVMADEIRREFVAMLEMTGFVDADYYRSSLGRPELRDPVGHYAEIGWRDWSQMRDSTAISCVPSTRRQGCSSRLLMSGWNFRL